MNVGVSGHQSIPPDALRFITQGIDQILTQVSGPLTGISSLAAGADQLFANAVLARGGSLQIVIPASHYDTTFGSVRDREAYESLLERAASVEQLPYDKPSEQAFLAAGKRIVDRARLLIAVWDGLPSRGKGGTADVVAYARDRGVPVKIIWPRGILR